MVIGIPSCCRCIHIPTEAHCEILKIIASLYNNVHETTNPVIRDPPCDFSICFSSAPMKGVAMKSVCSKEASIGNGDLLKFNFIFLFIPNVIE